MTDRPLRAAGLAMVALARGHPENTARLIGGTRHVALGTWHAARYPGRHLETVCDAAPARIDALGAAGPALDDAQKAVVFACRE